MLYACFPLIVGVAAGFKNVIEAIQIGGYICIRIYDTVAHASLCGQIHYNLWSINLKKDLDYGLVRNICFNKCEV